MLKMRLDIWTGNEYIIDIYEAVWEFYKYLVHEALESTSCIL